MKIELNLKNKIIISILWLAAVGFIEPRLTIAASDKPTGTIGDWNADKAENAAKGADAVRLLAAITELRRVGRTVNRIEVNEAQHVLCREAGQLFFISALSEGLEFPQPLQE